MFSMIFLASALLSLGASIPTDVGRQAQVTLRPEGESDEPIVISSFQRLMNLDPRIRPKAALLQGDVPPIVPKQSSSCSGVNYAFTASGQSAYLQSQNYPSNYPTNQDCSYTITSPAGTQMTFQCDTFNVACPNDYLFFSLDGSSNSNAYCGQGIISSRTTTSNKLTVGFHSSSSRPASSSAYNYQCIIKVTGTATGGPATTTTTVKPPPAGGSCSCGVRNVNGATRIVGGVQTKAGELPWRVTVFVYDPQTGSGGICGGTIISANWVMTAAHCTMDFKTGYKINVYTGAQANPVTVGGGTTVVVDRYVQHPSFNRNTLANDITLLHLPTPLTFKSTVAPACLPFSLVNSEFSGTSVLASGWGTTKPVAAGANNNDAVSSTLMEVVLPVLSTAECGRYQSVTDSQICTYQPGKDTCQGDSGGSIDYQNTNGRYYSIGVVSYGIGCAQTNYPGVYTKVTKFLPWIQSTTADTFCQL